MLLVTAHQLFGQVREVDQDRRLADQLCNLPAGNDSPQGLLHVEAGLIGAYLPRMPHACRRPRRNRVSTLQISGALTTIPDPVAREADTRSRQFYCASTSSYPSTAVLVPETITHPTNSGIHQNCCEVWRSGCQQRRSKESGCVLSEIQQTV